MSRCLYIALNDRIRSLLLRYDYSKSTDPLQPYAAHISSLSTRDHPKTWDIVVTDGSGSLFLHKLILSARSSYFRRLFAESPGLKSWQVPTDVLPQAFGAAIRYMYLGDAQRDLRSGPGTGVTESEMRAAVEGISKLLDISGLLDSVSKASDRRQARQRRTAETSRGRDEIESWFREHVLGQKMVVETSKVQDVKWSRDNPVFADVLLRADEPLPKEDEEENHNASGSAAATSEQAEQKSVLYPAHRAMLLRSEFFNAMFSSTFKEAQMTEHLNIIKVDCLPEVLEVILTFFYTDKVDFSLNVAVDVLFAADQLLIERLKNKAAVVISSLGSGGMSQDRASKTRSSKGPRDSVKAAEEIDIYEIIRAAWMTRVQRLEEFAARYFAYHLEEHIDTPEFAEIIRESAARIQKREETDSIELLDDIRFYLSERFRFRFDDTGLQEMLAANAPTNFYGEAKPAADIDTQCISGGVEQLNLGKNDAKPSQDNNKVVQPGIAPVASMPPPAQAPIIRTLDGKVVEDEFRSDAVNYQILMEKLDRLLERLNLDA